MSAESPIMEKQQKNNYPETTNTLYAKFIKTQLP